MPAAPGPRRTPPPARPPPAQEPESEGGCGWTGPKRGRAGAVPSGRRAQPGPRPRRIGAESVGVDHQPDGGGVVVSHGAVKVTRKRRLVGGGRPLSGGIPAPSPRGSRVAGAAST